MGLVNRLLGRRPLAVSAVILCAVVWAFSQAHDYIETRVRPARQAALRAELAARIDGADKDYRRKKFAAALSGYRVILGARASELSPADKGSLHHRAGLSLMGLADLEVEAENLAKAIEAFQAALAFRMPAEDGAGYAQSHLEIGRAQARLAEARKDPAHLDLALAAYREALTTAGAESDPAAYSSLQILIGNVWRDRFAAGNGQKDEQMNPALAAYAEAERVALAHDDRIALGRARMERATAYLRLADGIFKRTHTRNALADISRVLDVFTQSELPREFGRAQKLKGDIYMKMSLDVPVDTGQAWRNSQIRSDWEQTAQRAYALASQFGAGPPDLRHNNEAK